MEATQGANARPESARREAKMQTPRSARGTSRRKRKPRKPTWNDSPMRPTPHALKGLRLSVSREPWATDESVYNQDTTRSTTRDRWTSVEDAAGAMSHRRRASASKLDRPSFWRPAWQDWSDSLSA